MVSSRLVFGIAWVAGGHVFLSLVQSGIVLLTLEYLDCNAVRLPDEVEVGYNVLLFACLVIGTCTLAVMALRGALPGTQRPQDVDADESDTQDPP
jgi:hypothetical protein